MCFLFLFFHRTQARRTTLHSQENPSYFTFSTQGLLEASKSPATKPWLFLALQRVPFHHMFLMDLRTQFYFFEYVKSQKVYFYLKKKSQSETTPEIQKIQYLKHFYQSVLPY